MTTETTSFSEVEASTVVNPMVQWLILASFVGLVVQSAATDYGPDQEGAGVFWCVVGVVFLWFVHRRSNVARLFVVAVSLVGAILHSTAGVDMLFDRMHVDDPGRSFLVAIAFAGQALPLMTRAVRRHVGALN